MNQQTSTLWWWGACICGAMLWLVHLVWLCNQLHNTKTACGKYINLCMHWNQFPKQWLWKLQGESCWWLFTSRAWVRAKMVWASCGLDGGPIKVTRFALYSWGPLWSKHTNGVVLFYLTITANKLLTTRTMSPSIWLRAKIVWSCGLGGWLIRRYGLFMIWIVWQRLPLVWFNMKSWCTQMADSKVLLAMYHCDGLVFWYWALAGKQWNHCWLVFLLCLAAYNFQML